MSLKFVDIIEYFSGGTSMFIIIDTSWAYIYLGWESLLYGSFLYLSASLSQGKKKKMNKQFNKRLKFKRPAHLKKTCLFSKTGQTLLFSKKCLKVGEFM